MSDTPLSELEARLVEATAPPVTPVTRIDALNDLAWELRSGDILRANALAQEARELARDQGYPLGQARALRTMAMTMATDGVREVFDLAREARCLFDEAGDGPGRAASRDFLSSIHEYIGDLAGGMEWALDALSIAREIGDPVRQGYALSSVGGILAASGEHDAGVARLEQALALFEGVDDFRGIGTISSRLSKVLRGAGRNEEALTYANRCRALGEEREDPFLRLEALTVMGEIEEDRGRSKEAEAFYRDALACFPREPENPTRDMMGCGTQIALGRLLTQRGALDEAELELNDALKAIEGDTMSMVVEAEAHSALADLFERRGDLPATILHLRRAQELKGEVAKKDARNKLAQVEARAAIDAARRDAETQRLRLEELRNLQSKLVESEKMALLGKLAAGTAHELNTPLGVLRSNSDLAATAAERLAACVKDAGETGGRATKLAFVLQSCRATSEEALSRIAAIAQNFRRFSQLDEAERRSFDVREGVDSALALLAPTLPEGVQIERRLESVPEIAGWPRELNHAFMTVLQNAAQAIDGAGVVTAETAFESGLVLVRVRDTGRGMSKDQAAQLFDVDWSEGGVRTRMRLGLTAAYTTVQKHGGDIEVDSVLGEGTTVTFRLPVPGATDPEAS